VTGSREAALIAADNIGPDAPSRTPAATNVMRLRYAGTCGVCDATLDKGVTAEWNKVTRTVTCIPCSHGREPGMPDESLRPSVPPERPLLSTPGEAGASARREYERRHQKREQRLERKWGRLAPLAKRLSDDPQTTSSWAKGADGERRLAGHLHRVLGDRAVLLHDRKVPRTRGNIDHLADASSGVWVIDAKNYKGKVERRDVGGWFRIEYRLYVGGRDQTRLVDGLGWQIEAVEQAIGDIDVPVKAALCFTDSPWRLFAKPFQIDNAWVTWAESLAELIAAPGQLDEDDVIRVATRLGETLPPAARAVQR